MTLGAIPTVLRTTPPRGRLLRRSAALGPPQRQARARRSNPASTRRRPAGPRACDPSTASSTVTVKASRSRRRDAPGAAARRSSSARSAMPARSGQERRAPQPGRGTHHPRTDRKKSECAGRCGARSSWDDWRGRCSVRGHDARRRSRRSVRRRWHHLTRSLDHPSGYHHAGLRRVHWLRVHRCAPRLVDRARDAVPEATR